MQYYHEENVHFDREQTLFSLRSKYWILACRGVIRLVINSCVYCKREIIKTIPPFISDTPEDRLCVDEKQFATTGVDYFGSLSHQTLQKN